MIGADSRQLITMKIPSSITLVNMRLRVHVEFKKNWKLETLTINLILKSKIVAIFFSMMFSV